MRAVHEEPFSISDALEAHKVQRVRHLMRALPHGPRCKLCNAPFSGVGRLLLRPTPYKPSRLNPNLCDACFTKLPLGGAEMEIGVLFADVRGFTALTENLSPAEAERRLARFYRLATDAVVGHDGLVDKLVGDEVMALFLPAIVEGETCAAMVAAGEELLRGLAEEEEPLPVGIGIDIGQAFVGNVGPTELAKDFTAIGDVVNTASRLQGSAGPGELVLSERVWSSVADRFPDARRVELELKGKRAPVPAHVVRVAAA